MHLLTAKEAADLIGCSTSWITRHKQELGCVYKLHGKLKVNKEELIKYIENKKINNQSWQLEKEKIAPSTMLTSRLKANVGNNQLTLAISNLRKSLKAN